MKCPNCHRAKLKSYEEGYYIVSECPKCGFQMKEEIDPDYNDMPEGCAACGGNWPDCADSCPMYDD